MAKRYDEIEVTEWNVNHFFEYMNYLSTKLWNVRYAPMRSWNIERGLLGGIIGTKKKAGTHDKALIKEFIDITFSTYTPTAAYPAASFGFMWTYRQSDLQRAEINLRKQQTEEAAKADLESNDVDDWFLS